MAAKLQAMGYEAYFYEPAAGGHGYGKDNKERAALVALGYRFLRQTIGWSSLKWLIVRVGRKLMFEFAEPKNAIEGIADAAFFSV